MKTFSLSIVVKLAEEGLERDEGRYWHEALMRSLESLVFTLAEMAPVLLI